MPSALANAARAAQLQFEQFRRTNLPESHSSRGGSSCDEQVGRFCYWYDEKEPPAPREPDRIRDARTRADQRCSIRRRRRTPRTCGSRRSACAISPRRALDATRSPRRSRARLTETWRCGTLVGFAYHEAGRLRARPTARTGRRSRAMPAARAVRVGGHFAAARRGAAAAVSRAAVR